MRNGRPTENGELRVRVDTVERDVTQIERQVNVIRDTMATKVDMERISSAIGAIAQQQQPNYSLLVSIVGVAMLFLTMVGGFAYWPISTATTDLKAAIIVLAEKTVLQKQYDADREQLRASVAGLRSDLTLAVNSTVQQQRYNTDKAARDGEITILREQFGKVLSRSEFDSQHNDLRTFIQALMASRDRQLTELIGRLLRLESLHIKSAT